METTVHPKPHALKPRPVCELLEEDNVGHYIEGSSIGSIGDIAGDTRSLDYSSYRLRLTAYAVAVPTQR